MSDKTNDGGPAFPRTSNLPYTKSQEGMSLRDYFAGQAVAGLLSDKNFFLANPNNGIALTCYELADAMLKARGSDAP